MFKRVWGIAFGKFLAVLIKKRVASDEPDLIQAFDWHHLRNKRGKYIEGMLTEGTLVALVIIGLVIEPLRYLTKWFLRRGSMFRRLNRQRSGKTPPICDLVWLEASPVTKVLQYYTELLNGKASRLRLLWEEILCFLPGVVRR